MIKVEIPKTQEGNPHDTNSPDTSEFLRGMLMLTLRNQQPSLRDKVLPQELLDLPGELKVVDQILDDPRFFKPFLERFDTRMGRPAKAVEMYIRMMYLKFRYNLGYGTLVREVSDSIKWRQFCRIPLDGKVPDRSTLIKSTKRYGPEVVDELNKLLLEKAREDKVRRGRKLRVDTTVVESQTFITPQMPGFLQME